MSAGMSGYVVEDALDTDNPKLALMELLVQQRRESGAVANVVPALQAGGEDAHRVLSTCLEQALELLDLLSTSLNRKERKSVAKLLDRLESVAEATDHVTRLHQRSAAATSSEVFSWFHCADYERWIFVLAAAASRRAAATGFVGAGRRFTLS